MINMQDLFFFLLLLVAIACGFYLGGRRASRVPVVEGLPSRYVKGVNYLINDDTDSAIDMFIESLEVNDDTLETHLALGSLLRRKGQVDRAIKVHQNLLARPSLTKQNHHHSAQFELALDFVAAGLLDRAEALLRDLVTVSVGLKSRCLECLVGLYRDEREWEKAIESLVLLRGRGRVGLPSRRSDDKWSAMEAHFCCELADEALSAGNYLLVRRQLKRALSADKGSVRANLIWGRLECRRGRYTEAIRRLRRIPGQDADYIPEIIPLLCEAYAGLEDQSGLEGYLSGLLQSYPLSSLVVALAQQLEMSSGELEASEFVVVQLKRHPSLRGLICLVGYQLRHAKGGVAENLGLLKGLLEQLLLVRQRYRCRQCGFSGVELHWLCPSCKSWGGIRAVRGVDGE